MLDVIGSSIVGLALAIFGRSPVMLEPLQLLAWQDQVLFTLPPTKPEPAVDAIIQAYLQSLSSRGISPQQQGIWLQSDWVKLSEHQGTVPVSAASLTKIATTLAALTKWGPSHQFETQIYAVGEIQAGVLQGDLLLVGSGDPFFVWEEAIALGNALHQLGIKQVTGKLLVTEQFYMNYDSQAQVAGNLLKQALNEQLWTKEVTQQYLTLPLGTARPQVAIAGSVQVTQTIPDSAQLLIRHKSLSLGEILKQMNIYSNNKIAQMLADAVGGAKEVAQYAAEAAQVPQAEIQLINGSGLGVDNHLSPRAVCRMLMAIEQLLQSSPLKVVDLFPVAGKDTVGTMSNRQIPTGTAVKTGTLAQVSALAGVLSTNEHGSIWFAVINSSSQTNYLRQQQDYLLQSLAQHWQLTPLATTATEPTSSYLGDPSRNLLIKD